MQAIFHLQRYVQMVLLPVVPRNAELRLTLLESQALHGQILTILLLLVHLTLTATFTGPQSTHYLKASHYGFAIPAANVTGVSVTVNESCSGPSTGVTDNRVQLVLAGTVITTTNLATAVVWPAGGAFATQTYGGAVTSWVPTLSATDVNDPNFGVALSAKSTNSGRTAQVDYIKITVTYTVPGSLNWYTVSSGGTSIGSGTPFNPVGVVGSGLPDTNTPGTYPFYAECSTAPGCRTVANFVINPLPTITPAAAATNVCLSASPQTTTLTYTATNTPTTYSITWDAAATTAGFAPVTNVALPASPITISVPANAPVNTYTGTITVNNANGCISSTGASFTVTVDGHCQLEAPCLLFLYVPAASVH